MLIKLTEIEGNEPRDVFYNPFKIIKVLPGEGYTFIFTDLYSSRVKETPDEILKKIAEGGDKITLGPITMTAPEWLAQINRKFDQVDLLVSNKFRELLTRVADLEAKIAEQASAPVISDTAQEAREVLQMIADADTGTIQVDIDDEIASSDCRHCEWMKERAKEYLESHPAPVESHPCDTKPVESHQPAGDEAKWPEDVVIVDMFGDDYELSHEYTDEIPVHRMRIDKMDDDGNYQNVLIFDSLKSIESIHNFTGQWLRARQGSDEAKWPTVDVFAGIMKERLEANKDKGGWKDCTAGYLTKRLDEEARELTHAIVGGNVENIRCEAADVANFAMMIADNAEAIAARQGGTV